MNKKSKEPFNYQKLYRRTGLIIYDVLSIIKSSYVAILIRYEFKIGSIPDHFLDPVTTFLLFHIVHWASSPSFDPYGMLPYRYFF